MTAENVFEISTEYTINYRTKKHVPIADVIESLKSLEKLIHRTPIFVEKAFPGFDILDVEVYVDTLQTGSLIEKFAIKYVFKGQDNYDKAQEVIEKLIEDNSAIRTVVAMSIGGLITWGLISAIGGSTPSTHVEAYNNTIINVGAEASLKGKDFEAILNSIGDKKQLAQQAIGAIKPAKSDPEATIEMQGISDLTMSKEYISEAPEEYSPPIPLERTETYQDVSVWIYASDRDKNDSNWAGSVPNVIDKRIRFELGDEVDPAKLHGHTKVNADIIVTSQYNKSKKRYDAKLVTITSFTPFNIVK